MRIAQITDSHIVEAGALWKDEVDTAAFLRRAVDALNRIAPDLVVMTGDLVEDGTEAQYAHAAEILDALVPPLRILPGNHDGREAMRAAFPEQEWAGGAFLSFVEVRAGLRVIGLDTVRPGETGGEICATRLDWLKGALARDLPSLVFLHHPPAEMGLAFMDQWPFEGSDPLAALLMQRGGVLRLACGHVHAAAERHWAGTLISACPALSIQLPPLQPRGGFPPVLAPGGQAIRLHEWSEDLGLRVYTLPLEEA